MSETDMELLDRYARHRAEDAFEEIVRRHLNLVHSSALRQVHSPQFAEEIAQTVFLKLAENARNLAPNTILGAWLYQVARREAIGVVRREARRHLRERIATEMNAMNPIAVDWRDIEPILDEAMQSLDETDRAAVLLRYFENKSLREVGQALGSSENAAQKRLVRALERLREFMAKRDLTVGAHSLAFLISANAVQAAPAILATSATTIAIGGATASPVSTPAFVKSILINLAKSKSPILVSMAIFVVFVIVIETRRANGAADNADNSWRSPSLTWQQVGRTPPQVRILPTLFRSPVHHMLTSDGVKWGGINVSVKEIVRAAYRSGPGRVVFHGKEPQERYDFISTLPSGTEEALQRELKKTLGLSGQWKSLETNLLALRLHHSNAPSLRAAPDGPSEFGNLQGGHIHCFGQSLSWKSPMPPWGLTKHLERIFQVPVVDETGLTGSYNLDLRWEVKVDPEANQESVKQSLVDQLGLVLVPVRDRVEILVVQE